MTTLWHLRARCRVLWHKEWRDQRGLLVASVALAWGSFLLLEVLGGPRADASLRCELLHPLALAVFTALVTAEIFTSDAQRGVERSLAGWPVPPLLAWTAKLVVAWAAVALFAVVLLAAELVTRVVETPPAAAPGAEESPLHLVWILALALELPLIAALAVGLRRPLVAVLAALCAVGAVALLADGLPEHLLWLALSTWPPSVFVGALVAALAVFSAAIHAHRLRGHATRRRVLVPLALSCATLAPVGVPAFLAPLRWHAYELGDPRVLLGPAFSSPDGRYVAVQARQALGVRDWFGDPVHFSGDIGNVHVYDLLVGAWQPALTNRYAGAPAAPGGSRGPWVDGRLALGSGDVLQLYDPTTQRIVWESSGVTQLDQLEWERELKTERWWRTEQHEDRTTRVSWPANGNSVVVPWGHSLSPAPATVYFVREREVLAHDLATGEERSFGELESEPWRPKVSPCGRYLCLTSRNELRVHDAATGVVLFASTTDRFGDWCRVPGRLFLSVGVGGFAYVTASGERVPLAHPGYAWFYELDESRWLALTSDLRRCDVVDAAGRRFASLVE